MQQSAWVIGGGLAGCECAWQLAQRGVSVTLVEQRPGARTPAHQTGELAELVCSNSLRAAAPTNAVGLLKHEMRTLDSLIIKMADETAVPAGGALAVDRDLFSQRVTAAIQQHPNIRVVRDRVDGIPETRPCVICTGPLTSDELATAIASVTGAESIAYYDAIAPIIDADSIDWAVVFRGSRLGRGQTTDDESQRDAYANCPFDKAQYHEFVKALCEAEKVPLREFEDRKFFEGCLPIEVMAERGVMTLAFGPCKPIGLTDPRTGRWPFAVVQLRSENAAQTAFNMVGFQTRMTHSEQLRVFRTIPGLQDAKFLRLGSMHRNTFVDSPRVLDGALGLRGADGVYLAGQITGVEGYAESAACGLWCGIMLAEKLNGRELTAPPSTTAIGGLLKHLRNDTGRFQPSNVTWAHLEPLEQRHHKRDRADAYVARGERDLREWIATVHR